MRGFVRTLLAGLAGGGLAWALVATAHAQQQATAVQLPTYSFFGLNTTVSVPDQGAAYLGGIKRAASGRNELGVPMLGKLPFFGRPFTNRSIGLERSAMNMHVTATIHDFEAMEEALLGRAPASYASAAQQRALSTPAAMLGHVLLPRDPRHGQSWRIQLPEPVPPSVGAPATSVAAAAPQPAVPPHPAPPPSGHLYDAQGYFERGQAAEANGKAAVARIYYQMAARQATGELKEQILSRLAALKPGGSSSQVAQSQPQ